ncbi:MAG: hypothetical protein U0354_05300 [Candidatus Sericytochromatia bacterium]
MKNIKLLILVSILYSCTPNVNTTIVDKNKIPDNKVIPTVKPSILPSNEPSKQNIEVTDIFAFPENLILGIGEEKELYIKIKNSNGKYTDDFIIISSNNSIISVKDNKIKGLSEGISQITISSKSDISKTKVINIQVKDKFFNDRIVNLNELTTPSVYNYDFNNEFILDYSDNFNNNRLYSINNSFGYPILNKIEESKKSKYIFTPRIKENTNEKSYDLVVDIFHDNVIKKTVKINEFSYSNKSQITPIGSTFKNKIIKDSNNNFYIVYSNQFNETRLKIFDKDGNQSSKTVLVSDSNTDFNLEVSPKAERILFSQRIYNPNSSLKVKVFDKNLKPIFEKQIKSTYENNNISVSNSTYEGIANINDLGDLVIAWEKSVSDYSSSPAKRNKYIHLEKIDTNTNYESNYDFNVYYNNNTQIKGLFINNNSDINLFWSYMYNYKSLFTRYIPSDKHTDFTYLKVNQHYKLDTKYNKCFSSNEDVVTIKPQDSFFYSNQVGTATVTCFDENDYSKNNVIKINVGF